MASKGVVITVVEAPPNGAAMHCKANLGIHIGAQFDKTSTVSNRYKLLKYYD